MGGLKEKQKMNKGRDRTDYHFFMINMIKLTCGLSPAIPFVVFALLSIYIYIPSFLC